MGARISKATAVEDEIRRWLHEKAVGTQLQPIQRWGLCSAPWGIPRRWSPRWTRPAWYMRSAGRFPDDGWMGIQMRCA